MTPLRERIEGLRRFTAQKVAVVGDELAGRRMPLYLDRSDVLAALDEPWTSERPTTGKWWVAIHPDQRKHIAWACDDALLCEVSEARGVLSAHLYLLPGKKSRALPLDYEILRGAKWQRRTTPPDPFADKSEDKDR